MLFSKKNQCQLNGKRLDRLKKIFLFFLFASISFAQVGYVEIGHPVYQFLERMETEKIIRNYDSFELPKTRSEVVKYLKMIIDKRAELDRIDQRLLNDLLIEFEFDIYSTTKNYLSLTDHFSSDHFFNQKEKFFYYFTDTTESRISFFVNLIGEGKRINRLNPNSASSTLMGYGGSLRGSFYDHIGFYIKATNGTFFGDKNLARTIDEISYNYKFNLSDQQAGSEFFDETEGYLTLQYKHFNFKLGRDRVNIGYGPIKYLLGNSSPEFDYLSFNLNYSIFSISYLHGKLLGNKTVSFDSLQGTERNVDQKFFAYHRIGFNFSEHLKFGFGESVIYAERGIDLSYLNPFAFYKSVEHANQDRDNSLLFMDAENNSIDGLKFYGALLLDDMDFGKLGSDWYGNQALIHLGFYSTLLYNILPIDFQFHYVRVDPYFYTHRLENNNFTNLNYSLADFLEPNSDVINFSVHYRPHYRVNLKTELLFKRHGANQIQADGSIVNRGGDIALGFRTFDSPNASFLDGDLEYTTRVNLYADYEPFNNYLLSFELRYNNEELLKQTNEYLDAFFSINVKF